MLHQTHDMVEAGVSCKATIEAGVSLEGGEVSKAEGTDMCGHSFKGSRFLKTVRFH